MADSAFVFCSHVRILEVVVSMDLLCRDSHTHDPFPALGFKIQSAATRASHGASGTEQCSKALGSVLSLIPAALLLPILALRIRDEEALLSRTFPSYGSYVRRVPYRLAPYLW